ncbi:HlyD family secretion protein [Kordiimonas sp. SCSIO 12610]|uniref:HlyD family secretion protein n=1 Tax=Kordiimonas sp. SCSIO 12610 TaxID=2829597 RepID=UPI00210BBF94|nr:efflux RND transporter periplasmic adaptor subunit [Kordiimonas sp. SCSIO 12610]UTW55675.1 efflux RND transporter periplasmic adaptor subunit [Kordiimonas sp. SCSIO 12610]
MNTENVAIDDSKASTETTTVDTNVPEKKKTPGFLKVGSFIAVIAFLVYGVVQSYQPIPDQLQGTVDAREVRAASKVTGRIQEFFIEEGEFVQKGQLLFAMDSPEVEARRRQAEGVLASAKATEAKAITGARSEDIRAAEAQWLRAKAAADLADITFKRISRLFDEGVVAGQSRDEAEANALASREQERAAKAIYDQALAGARREDIDAASGQVERAKGAIQEIEAAENETRVYAPISGEAGKRNIQLGEIAGQGYPVLVITETEDPWVTLYLREDQYNDLAIEKRYTGQIPALNYETQVFEVTYIAPAGDFATWRATRQSSGFDIRSFEVRMKPVRPIKGLRPGMSVLFDWPQQ